MSNASYDRCMRSYRDLCGIARALDVVGERWALLVVRELMFGPKRFADLHRGLPGLSQNVLTQRLRDLEDSQVLVRRRALPPAAGLIYELTDHGRELEPVLLALGRWGSPLTQYDIAPVLKPNRNDKNVSSEELADFARGKGYGAVLAEQHDEWAEQRRYLGLDALAAARRVGEPDPDPEEVTEPDLRALTA